MSESVQTNLPQFQAAFARYVAVWTADGKKNEDGTQRVLAGALEKQGLEIGKALRKGFAQVKWGGPGKHPGLARAELDARSASGVGIKLRASLMAEYLSQRGELRSKLAGKKGNGAINRKIKLWQKFVKLELAYRQRSIGFLSTEFLWTDRREEGRMGTFFVQGKAKGVIGTVERQPESFRITGEAPGASSVGEEKGVLAAAIAGRTADIEKYLSTRERDLFHQVFGAN